MQISILILISAILARAPWETHRLFSQTYRRELSQIAVDNAAILLGQGDRDVMNRLIEDNCLLDRLEVLHHFYHACARSVILTAFCTNLDKAMESTIEVFRQLAHLKASTGWALTRVRAERELGRLETQALLKGRSLHVPIKSCTCPVCAREVHWEKEGPLPVVSLTEVGSGNPVQVGVSMVGQTLRKFPKWNYRLETLGRGWP